MIPSSLTMVNFFSHKKSYIDFTQFNSALLIGNTEGDYDLSNGSGKSSIFEGILWCLFNKARVAAMDDIILWGENKCDVIMEFIQEGTLYKVHRSRSRVSGSPTVSFSYFADDDWIDISGSTARLTNAKIVSVLKFDHKMFINSAYFRQNDISEFAESDPSKKKEILKSIIDLSKWDQYEKNAKAKLKVVKSEVDLLESKLESLEDDEIAFAKFKLEKDTMQSSLDELSRKRDEHKEILDAKLENYREVKSGLDTSLWDKAIEENKKIKAEAEQLKGKRKYYKDNIEELTQGIEKINKENAEFEALILSTKEDKDIDSKIAKAQEHIVKYKTKLSTAENLLEKASKKKIEEGLCHYCGQDISDEQHAKLLHNHEDEVEGYKKEIILSKNKLAELDSLMEKFNQVRVSNKKVQHYKMKIKSSKSSLDVKEKSLKEYSDDLSVVRSRLKVLKENWNSNAQLIESLKNDDFQKMQQEIATMKEGLELYNKQFMNMNRAYGVLTQKIDNVKTKIESMRLDKKKLVMQLGRKAVLEKTSKLLGKNGIQTILLNAVIEDLEKTANVILESICNEPLVILLETQRVGSDGVSMVDTLDLKVRKDGFVQNFKSLSGGEQFRISLSLRIALSEISSRHGGSSLEFLLLDEINSPLDRHGTENLFVNVINSLEKKYKIMVITHNDSLKEKFENVIDVAKVNGESTTAFIQK